MQKLLHITYWKVIAENHSNKAVNFYLNGNILNSDFEVQFIIPVKQPAQFCKPQWSTSKQLSIAIFNTLLFNKNWTELLGRKF